MGLSSGDYADQLAALLPRGKAWSTDADSNLYRLCLALADEFVRIDAQIDLLVDDVLPDTTFQMLEDWERAAGLPDSCVGVSQSVADRRKSLLTRLTTTGGQSPAFFIDLAAYLGFTVTITEFRPFTIGVNAVGQGLSGDSWAHAWRVNAPETTVTDFRVGSSATGESLQQWGNTLLECVFNRVKPAQTVLLFGYA